MDELGFVGVDVIEADGLHVVDGGGEGDGTFDIRSSSFEAEWGGVVSCFFETDFLDHFASALPGGEFGKEVVMPPENTDAGGRVEFVAGKGEEIGTERCHVDGGVGDGLGGIHDHEGTCLFGGADHIVDGIDGAEGVGDPREGEESGLTGE